MGKLRVDIWSDVVCPWCYIGKRRFETALARFEHRDQVEVVWRSFELDPNARPSSQVTASYAERLARKYGISPSEAAARLHHMTAMAAEEGLDFRFDIARGGNTFDAHRLLHLALDHGRQDEFKERLDRATFSEGLAVSEHEALARLAVEVGLPAEEVDAVLAGDRYAAAVRADEAEAERNDITAVPFFVFDGTYGVPGAQAPDYLLRALRHAWKERSAVTVLPGADPDASCDGDECAVV